MNPAARSFAALALVLAEASCGEADAPEPYVGIENERPVLRLPRAMRRVMDQHAPGFRPWEREEYGFSAHQHLANDPQAPLFGVVGDFNGDGIKDVALDGYNGRQEFTFVILSGPDSYMVVDLHEPRGLFHRERGLKRDVYLLPEPPGTVESPPGLEPGPLRLATDAIHVVYDSQASEVLYWKDGRFQQYATGD